MYFQSEGVRFVQGREAALHWRKYGMAMQPAVTPLFADAMWRGGGPMENDQPPAFNGQFTGVTPEMHHFAIERHAKGVNVLYFDGGVRYTRAKNLWGLPWHKNYNLAIVTTVFPGWMQ
jgi:prepilin-type processing-associated H-X9-DG protein